MKMAVKFLVFLFWFSTFSCKASSNADDVNSNWYQMKYEKTKSNGKSHQPVKLAGLDWDNIGADFKTVILQDLAKLPEENVVGDSEDAQMVVYKNLWIEAEASMCKLKYELQLARMKLAAKYGNQQTAAATAPADSSREAKASSLPKPENSLCTGESDDSSKQQNLVKESHINKMLLSQGGDADVFARLKVLKLRDESINCFREANTGPKNETSNRTDVDDTVFDNAVDARINSLVEDIIKERTEASSSEGDEAYCATLDGLPSRNNNTGSLDETNLEQLESSGSNTHGAFMAKLKDLMHCGDDISSSSEFNACQPQTASGSEFGQSGQLEDGVMARLQVLKRRVDNTSSVDEQGLFRPVFWAEQFEREGFSGGAHHQPIEKAGSTGDGVMARLQVLKRRIDNTSSVEGQEVFRGLSDDAGVRALSDEADSKTASQYVGSLLEEGDVPSAATEPASGLLHDERLSQSPSEWEHVLKEDFFLPGNPLK